MSIVESKITIDGEKVTTTMDGRFSLHFSLVGGGDGPRPELAIARVMNHAGTFDLTYERATGLVTAWADAPREEVTHA